MARILVSGKSFLEFSNTSFGSLAQQRIDNSLRDLFSIDFLRYLQPLPFAVLIRQSLWAGASHFSSGSHVTERSSKLKMAEAEELFQLFYPVKKKYPFTFEEAP